MAKVMTAVHEIRMKAKRKLLQSVTGTEYGAATESSVGISPSVSFGDYDKEGGVTTDLSTVRLCGRW